MVIPPRVRICTNHPVLPGGGGVLDLTVPNAPALAGTRITAQAVCGPSASGPWGMDFTNGLLLTLGY